MVRLGTVGALLLTAVGGSAQVVTIDMDHATLAEIAQEIARQTGVEVVDKTKGE